MVMIEVVDDEGSTKVLEEQQLKVIADDEQDIDLLDEVVLGEVITEDEPDDEQEQQVQQEQQQLEVTEVQVEIIVLYMVHHYERVDTLLDDDEDEVDEPVVEYEVLDDEVMVTEQVQDKQEQLIREDEDEVLLMRWLLEQLEVLEQYVQHTTPTEVTE